MVRRREEVVDGRHAPSVLGREGTQVEALRRERHLCTNQPVASMAWMTETRRENLIYALNITIVSSFSRRVSVYEKRLTCNTKMRGLCGNQPVSHVIEPTHFRGRRRADGVETSTPSSRRRSRDIDAEI